MPERSIREPLGVCFEVTVSAAPRSTFVPGTLRAMASGGAEFGRTLRELRRSLGLTRMRLADKSGLDAADVARWERGEDRPNPDQISSLAEGIDLDATEIEAWLGVEAAVNLTGPEAEVDITPQPEAAALRVAPAAPPRHPAPTERLGLTHRPRSSALPSVFPQVRNADYDPAVRVYSTVSASYPTPDDEAFYRLRRLRTAGVLLGLAIVLWWAVGSLGEGWSDVLDLFRTPSEAPLITEG